MAAILKRRMIKLRLRIMMKLLLKFVSCLFFYLLLALTNSYLFAQIESGNSGTGKTFSKSSIFIGTQIPLQFTAGYAYRVSNHFSAKAQVGFLTQPYDGLIVNSLQAFGLDKNLGRVIKKAFRTGSLLGIGLDYHFGKNYAGISGQYIDLKGGGITPADALSVYFNQDFSNFDPTGLPAFEFNMQSDILNINAIFGHEFQLRNPHLSLNTEVGLSKIVASKNYFSSNRSLVDGTAFARNIYNKLDKEMRTAFWKYGFVPTISVYLVYRLP